MAAETASFPTSTENRSWVSDESASLGDQEFAADGKLLSDPIEHSQDCFLFQCVFI